jgi:hypothetical protein
MQEHLAVLEEVLVMDIMRQLVEVQACLAKVMQEVLTLVMLEVRLDLEVVAQQELVQQLVVQY